MPPKLIQSPIIKILCSSPEKTHLDFNNKEDYTASENEIHFHFLQIARAQYKDEGPSVRLTLKARCNAVSGRPLESTRKGVRPQS